MPAAHGGIFSIKNPNEKIIDFSSNVNPLGCHPGVKKYLKKQLNQFNWEKIQLYVLLNKSKFIEKPVFKLKIIFEQLRLIR